VPGFASGKAAQPLIWAQAFLVASKGRNKALAQDFVTSYATRTDVAKALYDVHRQPPALISAVEQVRQADPDAQRFLDVAKGGVVAPPLPEMGVVWDAFGKAEAAVIGGADVTSTVQAATSTIQAAVG
jgi:arabinogalactan oligomer/maltooligosaccharide transport system substrate-binding protein